MTNIYRTPLPPAVMTTIFRNDEKYVETYLKPIPVPDFCIIFLYM